MNGIAGSPQREGGYIALFFICVISGGARVFFPRALRRVGGTYYSWTPCLPRADVCVCVCVHVCVCVCVVYKCMFNSQFLCWFSSHNKRTCITHIMTEMEKINRENKLDISTYIHWTTVVKYLYTECCICHYFLIQWKVTDTITHGIQRVATPTK